MNKSAVDFCPVPIEQQPINEYKQLKDSWLFCWATMESANYGKKIVWVGFWSWLVIAAPIAMASFPLTRYPLQFGISSVIGTCLIVALVLTRIYLGWSYIRDRLQKERIFYEESGWYDGQTWLKPTSMLNRDRLIVSYQIEPLMLRLQKTFLLLAGLLVFGGFSWLIMG